MNLYNITISESHSGLHLRIYSTEARTVRGAIAHLRDFFGSRFIKEMESGSYINNYEGIKAHVVKGNHIIGEEI